MSAFGAEKWVPHHSASAIHDNLTM
jgi:hypothetical protein